MIWFIFWLFLGSIWSYHALLEYHSQKKVMMSVGCQLFNILINSILLPFGLIFGVFFFCTVHKITEGDKEKLDFNFTVFKLLTHYK